MSQESISWGELSELTHATQVEKFNWCSCEEQEEFPYDDCPRLCEICEENPKENTEGKWCASCRDNFKESETR